MLKGDIPVRSTIEVVFDILEVADRGGGSFDDPYEDNDHHTNDVMQTEIINKVNLGDGQLKGYLKVLTKNDILRFDSSTSKFKITQKGRKFVQIYNKMNDLLKEG